MLSFAGGGWNGVGREWAAMSDPAALLH